ncbi:MAG: hypothetical protein ACXWF0_13445 [Usitatibacter sp.]
MNRLPILALVAFGALAGCDAGLTAAGEVTLKEGVRGCATLADANEFEKIEQARDWQASMEMLRSGRCVFVVAGDRIVVEKAALDGSTQFRERGRDRSLWTKETIKAAARGG